MKTALLTSLLASVLAIQYGFSADSPAIDTTTPKGTAKSVFDLSVAGDFDGMRKLFVAPANEKEKELLAEGFSDDLYVPALSTAILEKFPDAQVPKPDNRLERAKAEIEKMTEKIEGETATLTPPEVAGASPQHGGPFQQPIILKKEGGTWRMAIVENRFIQLRPPNMREGHKARCEAILGLIRDVKAGKYTSFEEVEKDMRQKEEAVRKKFQPASHADTGGGAHVAHPLDDPNSSEDDKKAVEIIKATDVLIEQKKAAEAEAKLLELFPLKSKLSPKIRDHVPFVILSLIMLEPERGKKLRAQWDKP